MGFKKSVCYNDTASHTILVTYCVTAEGFFSKLKILKNILKILSTKIKAFITDCYWKKGCFKFGFNGNYW